MSTPLRRRCRPSGPHPHAIGEPKTGAVHVATPLARQPWRGAYLWHALSGAMADLCGANRQRPRHLGRNNACSLAARPGGSTKATPQCRRGGRRNIASLIDRTQAIKRRRPNAPNRDEAPPHLQVILRIVLEALNNLQQPSLLGAHRPHPSATRVQQELVRPHPLGKHVDINRTRRLQCCTQQVIRAPTPALPQLTTEVVGGRSNDHNVLCSAVGQ